MKDNLKLETVAVANFAHEGELIRSVLESGGFEAYVINENAPVYVPLVQSVLVQVESSRAEAAKKFLEENLSAEPVDDNATDCLNLN